MFFFFLDLQWLDSLGRWEQELSQTDGGEEGSSGRVDNSLMFVSVCSHNNSKRMRKILLSENILSPHLFN